MHKKEAKSTTPVAKGNEATVITFIPFNGVFMAKISSVTSERKTHAFGATKAQAQLHALAMFRLKYSMVSGNL